MLWKRLCAWRVQAFVSVIFLVSCASTRDDAVPAIRYQVFVADSVMDAEHGGGQWIDEVWLQESGVCFNVLTEYYGGPLVGHAFFSTMTERTAPTTYTPPTERAPVQIQVPRRVADQALQVAKARKTLDDLETRVGNEWKSVFPTDNDE